MPTIGILYPGEMGAALGRLLGEAGFPIVTTLEGRSTRTQHLCRAARLQVLDSLRDVAEAADIVFSLVPPHAASTVAEQFSVVAPPRAPLFVDANAISPATAEEIARLLAARGVGFVDAAIHGLAAGLAERGTLYLSGIEAARVAALFSGRLKVKLLGEAPGRASALKMLMSGMNKGLVALFIEMSLAARALELDDELLEGCQDSYPGVMAVVERLLPTYPHHARRRADEMRELEYMVESLGLCPHMAGGAQRVIASVSALELNHEREGGWTVAGVIQEIHKLRSR